MLRIAPLSQLAVNGGCPCNAQLMSEIGALNILLGETVVAHFETSESTNFL